ncbi:helix-turn-helix transcriptional regulator [Thalassospira sp. ER-Se-21-Dark]|uniref:helix-turn-helix transcriptional regulator n=1 Tax=Thalassospira sp. ER-Se-21-Dark TaxID=2585190 RepID=UPI001B3124E7|nr:helix-turn-helix transcriptional regulator [Thalassospira sp. ER-Se-21-Dark]MBP3125732.1 helix-turn-helix transcriptional regulator [Thalassospira sp. ER-Se-21-Dark]
MHKDKPAPSGAGFRRLSTRHERSDLRFEYWRSLHHRIDIQTPTHEGAKNYNAELLQCVASDGLIFGLSRSDDRVVNFARPEGEFAMISIPVGGRVKLIYGDDVCPEIAAGRSAVVGDGTRSLTTITDTHSHVYLAINRDSAMLALNGGAEKLDQGVSFWAHGGMADMLRSHLQNMAVQGEDLATQEVEIAMKVAVELSLGVLAQGVDGHDPQEEISTVAIYESSRRFIQISIGRMDLTAEVIAQSLGCSRSHLYQVFELHHETVGNMIRRYRFENAVSLLGMVPYLSVKQIAYRSGYKSPAAFSRSFREYTGMSPTDFRAYHEAT